jgi:glycosyltransferase involved in cell wall biosynthesis
MENKPKISFVIPAYNCAGTIRESVDFIFKGNFEAGDEVIIVNDASSDNTLDIIKNLQKTYPQIKIMNNSSNLGCPASRNIGIRSASNSLIFNLDGDNILVPGSISRLKNYLISQKADIAAFSEYHYFQNDTKKITHKWIYKGGVMTLADFLAGPITPGPGGNFLYTKASWERIGGYWEYGKGLHEAWGFTFKQLANGAKFAVMPDSFYFHRYGANSLFTREAEKADENSLMATKMIMNFIGLINEEDAAYIKSEKGSRNWFNDFHKRPVRLKTEEIGTTGKLRRNYILALGNKLKKIFRLS